MRFGFYIIFLSLFAWTNITLAQVPAISCKSLFQAYKSQIPQGMIAVSGYASVFDVVDGYGHVTGPETFLRAVQEFKEDPTHIYMQFNHDRSTDIGVWTHFEIDDYGLYVEGYLNPALKDTQDMFKLWRQGPFDGLSIGGRRLENQMEGRVVRITDYKMFEISIVTDPANPKARFEMLPSEFTRISAKDKILGTLKRFLQSE